MLGIWNIVKRHRRPVKRVNKTYQLHKETARTLITSRLQHFNQFYRLTYNRVAIRDQRRCWGSCSAKGNLNFSYKLLFLPACLRDYVIVHELAHLRVLNHSADFWAVVAEVMPDYAERAQALRRLERTVGTAVTHLQRASATHPQSCVWCTCVNDINYMQVVKETELSAVVTA